MKITQIFQKTEYPLVIDRFHSRDQKPSNRRYAAILVE